MYMNTWTHPFEQINSLFWYFSKKSATDLIKGRPYHMLLPNLQKLSFWTHLFGQKWSGWRLRFRSTSTWCRSPCGYITIPSDFETPRRALDHWLLPNYVFPNICIGKPFCLYYLLGSFGWTNSAPVDLVMCCVTSTQCQLYKMRQLLAIYHSPIARQFMVNLVQIQPRLSMKLHYLEVPCCLIQVSVFHKAPSGRQKLG